MQNMPTSDRVPNSQSGEDFLGFHFYPSVPIPAPGGVAR